MSKSPFSPKNSNYVYAAEPTQNSILIHVPHAITLRQPAKNASCTILIFFSPFVYKYTHLAGVGLSFATRIPTHK